MFLSEKIKFDAKKFLFYNNRGYLSKDYCFTTFIEDTINHCLVIIAKGPHPIPFRTRK